MPDRKVKGTMLIDQVKMIRGNKDRDWSKLVKPEDWALINGRILDFAWYPLELYQRWGWATFQVLAGGSTDLARMRGKLRGQELFRNVYSNLLHGQDPMRALDRFVNIYGLLFNFSSLRFEKVAAKEARVYHDYDPNDPTNVPYCYQLMGHIDALVEMSGGRNGGVELVAAQWSGAPETVFRIMWE